VSLPQIRKSLTGPLCITLEAVKALAALPVIELDAGRVESILEIALSNAINVRSKSQALSFSLIVHPL
jgi:hypothetical protein